MSFSDDGSCLVLADQGEISEKLDGIGVVVKRREGVPGHERRPGIIHVPQSGVEIGTVSEYGDVKSDNIVGVLFSSVCQTAV